MSFPMSLAWREMETASSRIWTRVANCTSYGNNNDGKYTYSNIAQVQFNAGYPTKGLLPVGHSVQIRLLQM